jgi:hypothetical protein
MADYRPLSSLRFPRSGQALVNPVPTAQAVQGPADDEILAELIRRGQVAPNVPATPVPVDQTVLDRSPPGRRLPLDQRPRYNAYPPVIVGIRG